MYNVTNNFHEAAFGDSREITVRAVFNATANDEGVEVDGAHIKDVTIEEVVSADGLSIGSTCSNKVTINMYMPEETIPLSNGWVETFVGIPSECPLGKFYITDVVTKDKYKTVTITAYDKMCHLSKTYSSTLTFPAKVKAVVEDIASQNGFSIDSSVVFPDYTVDAIEATEREMLGYCAGLMGKNAKFNRDGKLTFVWFTDTDMDIPLEAQYQNGFKETTADSFVLGGLISGTEENPLTVGSGRTITFTNPFMTQDILNSILNRIQGFTYTPCEVKYRCDPSYETGDIVEVVDDDEGDEIAVHAVPIMAQTIKIGGGLNSTIYAYGVSEESESLLKSPSKIEIERIKSSFEEYMSKISDNITGANGGYYHLDYDESGFPSGWTIMDTPTLTPTTKLWKMSAGGFGYSKDGGKTFGTVAFDLEGNFYANAITSGELDCSNITVKNLNAESITVGSISKEQLAQEVSESIDTAVNTVADLEERANNGEFNGEDGTVLRIDSSRGTVFKSNEISTILTVTIFRGSDQITDINSLHEAFGNSAYLRWHWQKVDDSTFNYMPADDERFSNNGFTLTIAPDDVDTKVTFMCELVV